MRTQLAGQQQPVARRLTALPPEAITEPVRAIKAPLPSEVDGDRISLEVIGVDWGRNYQPYRSNKADLNKK